ncbi:MAG: FAD:protein FMN transferase [Spirochaetales bacterium]|nr:FAD:protein FMN transferase [Spirochaetales bacterium]
MEYNLKDDMLLRKIVLILPIILFLSCRGDNPRTDYSFLALNTTCTVSIFGNTEINKKEIEEIVNNIESLMSRHIVDSDVSKINSLSGKDFFTPDKSTLEVIKRGLFFSNFSEGKLDITIGPLVKLWNIGEAIEVPDLEYITKAISLVNYNLVNINDTGSVKLEKAGMLLDLGSIAKGYAADKVKEFLISKGVKSAIINLGGNINLIGSKPDGEYWKVGIQHPERERGEYIGILELKDQSFVTSGNYERYFEVNGIRYHHILSSKTGFPINGDIVSSSIVSNNSLDGDGMSTTTFGLDIPTAVKYVRKIGVQGVFITKDTIYIPQEFSNSFHLKDSAYGLITY